MDVHTPLHTATARFHWMMLAIAGTLIACDLILARMVGLGGFGQMAGGALYSVLLLSMIWWYAWWRGYARFQETCLIVGWAVVITNALSVLIQVAGRSSAPLVDLELSHVDTRIGWNTAYIVAMMAHAPFLRSAFLLAYSSLPLLVISALIVPVLRGRPCASREFILSVTIAGVITSMLFACLPAVGPWTVHGYAPSTDQVTAHDYLHALKAPGPMMMDFQKCGVVSFPSFHTVLALLGAAALWRFDRLRWVVKVLAAAIVGSTVTTGWHYGIDVLAGIAVALVSQRVARATVGGGAGGHGHIEERDGQLGQQSQTDHSCAVTASI